MLLITHAAIVPAWVSEHHFASVDVCVCVCVRAPWHKWQQYFANMREAAVTTVGATATTAPRSPMEAMRRQLAISRHGPWI